MLPSSWQMLEYVLHHTEEAITGKAVFTGKDRDRINDIQSAYKLVNKMINDENAQCLEYEMDVLYQQMDSCLCGLLELCNTLPYDHLIIMTRLCLDDIRRSLDLYSKKVV